MASRRKKTVKKRNPVVRDGDLLRKGGPHGKSKKAERAADKRKLLDEADD
jgi:hypothetical protein